MTRKAARAVSTQYDEKLIFSTSQQIVLRSYKEATEDLLLNLQAINNLTKEISAPGDGESVVIGEQTQSYSISLSEGLMGDAQGRWSKVRT